MTQDTPQELVIFSCALVITGEGTLRRPRLLILSAPSVEGADPAKIASEWISLAKQATAFPIVHDLFATTGFELAPGDKFEAPARPKPDVRVNLDHPAFHPTADDMQRIAEEYATEPQPAAKK